MLRNVYITNVTKWPKHKHLESSKIRDSRSFYGIRETKRAETNLVGINRDLSLRAQLTQGGIGKTLCKAQFEQLSLSLFFISRFRGGSGFGRGIRAFGLLHWSWRSGSRSHFFRVRRHSTFTFESFLKYSHFKNTIQNTTNKLIECGSHDIR